MLSSVTWDIEVHGMREDGSVSLGTDIEVKMRHFHDILLRKPKSRAALEFPGIR